MEKAAQATDWLVYVFFAVAAIVATARFIYHQRFRTFLFEPGSNSYLEQYLNQSERGKDAFTVLMELFFYPTAAVLMVLWIKVFQGTSPSAGDWVLWLEITLALALFFVANNLLISLFSYLFSATDAFAAMSFQKMTYRQWALIGPAALGFVALFAEAATHQLLLIAMILFVVLYVYGLARALSKHFSAIKLNMIHFILYLCALEIAPVLIVLKWL